MPLSVPLYSTKWNPWNPKTLNKTLYDIGQVKGAVVPVECGTGGAVSPNCFSSTEWIKLGDRTQSLGEGDATLWTDFTLNTQYTGPKFMVANVNWSDANAGFIYPSTEEQDLGAYFQLYILGKDVCA